MNSSQKPASRAVCSIHTDTIMDGRSLQRQDITNTQVVLAFILLSASESRVTRTLQQRYKGGISCIQRWTVPGLIRILILRAFTITIDHVNLSGLSSVQVLITAVCEQANATNQLRPFTGSTVLEFRRLNFNGRQQGVKVASTSSALISTRSRGISYERPSEKKKKMGNCHTNVRIF